MKNIHLLLALLLLPTGAFAQSIIYSYDAAGNRTGRTYVVSLRSASADNANRPDSSGIEASLSNLKVIVYPNPTKGALTIEVSGMDQSESYQMKLFDPKGRQLTIFDGQPGSTPVNMSSYPSGWYILRMYAKEKTLDFKIVKQ